MILCYNKKIIILIIFSYLLILILKLDNKEEKSKIVQSDSNSRLIYSEHIYHTTTGFTNYSTSTGFGTIISKNTDSKLYYL